MRASALKVVLAMSSLAIPLARAADQPPQVSETVADARKEPARERTLDLGNNVVLKLVLIPAGKFLRGSPVTDKKSSDNERPQREVTITRPFYMGVYEVTQEQFQQIMGSDPSPIKGPSFAANGITWNNASDFCKKASEKTGCEVRLPTDAEWEYACRAGTTTPYSFGDNEAQLSEYARCGQDVKPGPVGEKKPNPWGLYDMHGNVSEWCADFWVNYAKASDVDPVGATSYPYGGYEGRCIRGGHGLYQPRYLRSAYRMAANPESGRYQTAYFGFRVVVNVTVTAKDSK